VLDLAMAVALGGDCAADIAVLRAQPGVFGLVASDPTVSRVVATLAEDVDAALGAIAAARVVARQWVWGRVGQPVQDGRVVIDLDATLVTAHSEKESATRTWKKTFGFHPLLAYADHGVGGTGESLAGLLRPGNAGSNTATDHIEVFNAALAQLPQSWRTPDEHGRRAVLVGVQFSVGASLHHFDIHTVLNQLPEQAWTPAYQVRTPRAGQHGPVIEPREGAWVAEATGLVELTAWPAGTRLILRRERPHPGAQLRITDVNGYRIVGMLTNTPGGQLPDLELRQPPRPSRRPHPQRQRHRNAQPTLPRPGAESDLVGDHRPSHRPAGLHPATGPHRPCHQLRTQMTAAAHPGRRRTPRAQRTTPTAPHRPRLALGPPDHHRPRPPDSLSRTLTHATGPTKQGPEHRPAPQGRESPLPTIRAALHKINQRN
jgi:Transposase DDE domain group 1